MSGMDERTCALRNRLTRRAGEDQTGSMMRIETATVEANDAVADGYMVMALRSPRIARAARPGQFVHLRVPAPDSAVLRRPFSIFRAGESRIAILYKVVGIGTRAMASLDPGSETSLIGPLGNGFPEPGVSSHPVLVAGGYGVAPLAFLQSRSHRPGTVFLGARTACELVAVRDVRRQGWEVVLATEDGSRGVRGLVTEALDRWIEARGASEKLEFFACGPDGMLRAVAARAAAGGWKAWVSLDRHMGCGVGACLACAQKMRAPDGSEIRVRVCRDGPVFEGSQVIWDEERS